MRAWRFVWVCCLAAAVLVGCSDEEQPVEPGPTRPFALGFGYFPHDGTAAGVQAALDVIRTDADLLVAHFDGGIPWDAALSNDFASYPQSLRDEVTGIAAARPAGHRLYLAITPIAFLRDRLAPTLTSGGPVYQPPWDTRSFDDPAVIAAYRNHCHIMIDRFRPDYVAFGIEVNLFRQVAGAAPYTAYLTLADSVYADLKQSYPTLPVFQTLQADAFYVDVGTQTSAIQQILPTTDYIAVSAYPYANAVRYPDQSDADPALLPPTFFSALHDLAPGKPFAVAETGWPAEDVDAPYPVTVHSNADYQRAYIEFVLGETDRLGGRFASLLISRDYDDFWESTLKNDPNAAILRLWRDIGLIDGSGTARPALAAWRDYLARTLR